MTKHDWCVQILFFFSVDISLINWPVYINMDTVSWRKLYYVLVVEQPCVICQKRFLQNESQISDHLFGSTNYCQKICERTFTEIYPKHRRFSSTTISRTADQYCGTFLISFETIWSSVYNHIYHESDKTLQ